MQRVEGEGSPDELGRVRGRVKLHWGRVGCAHSIAGVCLVPILAGRYLRDFRAGQRQLCCPEEREEVQRHLRRLKTDSMSWNIC